MVQRFINWKVLLATVVLTAVLGAGVYFLHGWQVGRTAQELQRLASGQEEQADWLKAADFLERYVRMRPDDGPANARLALTYTRGIEQGGSTQRAAALHYRALSKDQVQERELRASLAGLLLDLGKFSEAEAQARMLLKQASTEGQGQNPAQSDDPATWRALGLALAYQLFDGSLAAANFEELKILSAVERAMRLNPTDVRVAEALATIYREWENIVLAEHPKLTSVDRQARADAAMDRLVSQRPQDGKIVLARYFYRVKHSLPGADGDLETALRLAPDEPEVLVAAGGQALQAGQRLLADPATANQAIPLFEKSQGYFQKLVDQSSKEPNPTAHLGLGETWLALGQQDQALDAWRQGLKQFKTPHIKIALHSRIADVLMQGESFAQAADSVSQIDELSRQLGPLVLRDYKLSVSREQDLRKASLLYRKGELPAAIPLLRAVIIRQPQGDTRVETTVRAWLLLATIQYSLGDWAESASAFDQVASLQPKLRQPRLAASQGYLLAGRPALAAERAEEVLAIEDNVDAWLTLATAQLQLQVAQPPASRQWSRLKQALAALDRSKAQLADGQPWRVDFLRVDQALAMAATSAEGAAQAAGLLQQAEGTYASEPTFWLQVCLAYQNLGLAGDADRALAECRQQGAKAVAVAAVAARLAAQRDDFAGAKKILEEASLKASLQERAGLQAELLRVATAAKDIDTVRNILSEQHRRQPTDLAVIRRLAELELEQGQPQKAEAWERMAADKGGVPGQTLASYLRAWRLFRSATSNEDEQLKAAMRDLEQVVLARPNWPEAAALKGMTAQRLGRTDEAVRELERAIELGDRRLTVYEQLIGILDQLSRTSEVERYLSRLEAVLPKTQRLAEMASVQELRRENPGQAVEIARKAVEQRPADLLAHLWLGRMHMVANQLPQAEQSFEKGLELAPADPRAWSAMLSLCGRAGDRAKVEGVLKRLSDNTQLETAQKSFLIAQAYELSGDREAARSQYTAASSQAPENVAVLLRSAQFHLRSDVAEAERLLRRALELDDKSLAAKRMLAIALASQGEGKLEEAQQLLSEAKGGEAVTAEDQRLRALLLAQQGGVVHLDRAVKIFEAIVAASNAPPPTDRQLLAQFYERQALLMDDAKLATARLDAAQVQLEQAVAAPGARPTSTAVLIQFLLRQNKPTQAVAWLDKLEASATAQAKPPADLTALIVQLQLQAKVVDRCDPWLQKLAAVEPDSPRLLALRAQVAVMRDPAADVEAIIEAKAVAIVAAAGTVTEQKKLVSGVGELYTSLKRHQAAERWYRKLVALAPEQYPLVVGALARQARLADAIATCEEAAKTDATTRPAMVMITALSENAPSEQDYKQAEPLLGATLAKFDKDVGLLYATTLVRISQKRFDDAADLYREILAINPKFVPALNNLAMLLAEQPAARNEAIALIDRAIEIVGKDAGLLDTKGAILTYSSRSAEALPLLVAATRSPTADPRHHLHLAVAYRDQGDLEQAKTQLQTALDRQLEAQVLMPTDKRLLVELRTALAL